MIFPAAFKTISSSTLTVLFSINTDTFLSFYYLFTG